MRTRLSLVTLAVIVLFAATPRAQGGFTAVASVSGNQVVINWPAAANAAGYRVNAGSVLGGSDLLANLLTTATGVGPAALGVGEYFVRVQALDATLNVIATSDVSFQIGTPRPGTPQAFQATLSGSTLGFTWAAPATGGAPTGYALQVGTVFGGSNVANGLALAGPSQFNIGGLLGPGTYFARLYAVNGSGAGNLSDEAIFTVGTQVPGVPVPQVAQVNGTTATLSWLAPAGGAPVTQYRIEAALWDPRSMAPAITVDGSQTSLTVPNLPANLYFWRVRAISGGAVGGASAIATFAIGQSAVTERRPANPAFGRRLPMPPYTLGVIHQVAGAYPAQFRNSCREHGGNNDWLFLLVRELRKYDTRWGLNGKRGNINDMSQDIIAYNFGTLPDEGTTEVYILDTIAGHCGSPSPWLNDVTAATAAGGAIGRWTLVPYLTRGLPLIP